MLASQLLKQHIDEIRQIAKKYELKGIYNLRVFGSVARGDDTEGSDIDFLVDVNSDLHPSLYTLIDMNDELEDLLGLKVDLVTARSLPDLVKERIAKEAVRL
jgi:predicted nucleotidyltransferase